MATLKNDLSAWWRRQKAGLKYRKTVGLVRFGSLRRVQPVSPNFGYGHGCQRVGRYYVDRFIASCAADIRGRVLEIADDTYTLTGGDRVVVSDVLHATAENPRATVVADLCDAPGIESGLYDCVICTQTLQFIFDADAAIRTLHRITKPGGVVLATGSGISQVSRYDMDRWGDYWRFTSLSLRLMFERYFGAGSVEVRTQGNVLTATAMLQGLSTNELREDEINFHDPDYEVMITVRAVKREAI